MNQANGHRLYAPTLGPLLTPVRAGLSNEVLRLSIGFEAAWGPPQALVLATRHHEQHGATCQIEHVLPWPDCLTEGSATHCVEWFDLAPGYWQQHPTLTCLLAYGFDSLIELKTSALPWPSNLRNACHLSWPQAWADLTRTETCFVVGSCQYPSGLLDGAPDAQDWPPGPADASFARLLRWRQDQHQPIQPLFALLLGDQVYVDATAGLFDPQTINDHYVQPYLTQMQHDWRTEALHQLPILSLPDDHEFQNDWQPAPHTRIESARQQTLQDGLAPYWRFQRMQDPQPIVWQKLDRHGASFFLADTRTERNGRTVHNIDAAEIMSAAQMQALTQWLSDEGPHPHPKFLACPSAILPRRRHTHMDRPASALFSDAWDGYPHSLCQLLAYVADHAVQNLVLLSGDEHLSSLAHITVQRLEHPEQAPALSPYAVVHTCSIHSSGWYAPFPFANSQAEDLRGDDCFEFTFKTQQGETRHYRCTVKTDFYPGDGCALVQTTPQGQIRCRFLKAQTSLEPKEWINLSPTQGNTKPAKVAISVAQPAS